MALKRKLYTGAAEALAENRQVLVVISTDEVDRQGDVVVQDGIVLDAYRDNPVVLWQHDPMQPIARCIEIAIVDGKLRALVQFPPEGTSEKADEVYGLIRSGVINATSIGFISIDAEPMDENQPWAGQRFLKCELLEFSFVSVPANRGATVTERSSKAAEDWKVGASRELPILESDDWDGGEAAASIFEHAGGDDFDPARARQGFLVYDASSPKLRGSYKLPFARTVGGDLKAVSAGIRAAASRLPQADIPEDVQKRARAVIDHYEERMKEGKAAVKLTLKGLYEVGWLAHLLDSLGCLHDMTALETAAEGDGSGVPAMLADALQRLGAALVAMTAEEVAELLAGKEEPDGDGDAEVVLRRVKAFRAGLKAGRVLSTANYKRLKEALGHHDKALEQHKAAGEHHEAAGEHIDAIGEAHEAAQDAHEALGKSLAAAQEQPEQAEKHVKAAIRKHATLGKQLDSIADHQDALGDSHDALGNAHRAMGRSVKAIGRCIKAVTDTADDSAESEEADEGQGGVSGSSDPEKSALRRRVTVLRLQGAA